MLFTYVMRLGHADRERPRRSFRVINHHLFAISRVKLDGIIARRGQLSLAHTTHVTVQTAHPVPLVATSGPLVLHAAHVHFGLLDCKYYII